MVKIDPNCIVKIYVCILQLLETLKNYTKNFVQIWALLTRFDFLLSDNLLKRNVSSADSFLLCVLQGWTDFYAPCCSNIFFSQQLVEGIKPPAVWTKKMKIIENSFSSWWWNHLITTHFLASLINIFLITHGNIHWIMSHNNYFKNISMTQIKTNAKL